MRTNHSGITEKAEFNVDREKYAEGWDRIFGKKEDVPVRHYAEVKIDREALLIGLEGETIEELNVKVKECCDSMMQKLNDEIDRLYFK